MLQFTEQIFLFFHVTSDWGGGSAHVAESANWLNLTDTAWKCCPFLTSAWHYWRVRPMFSAQIKLDDIRVSKTGSISFCKLSDFGSLYLKHFGSCSKYRDLSWKNLSIQCSVNHSPVPTSSSTMKRIVSCNCNRDKDFIQGDICK